MTPGRELDALVAEKVMGWRRPKWTVTSIPGDCMIPPNESLPDLCWTGHVDFQGAGEKIYWTPKYSTDIAAAWDVVEKLSKQFEFKLECERFDPFDEESPLEWEVSLREHYTTRIPCENGEASTAPHVICLAALKAVGENI